MKTAFLSIIPAILIFLFIPFTSVQATNYNNNGTGTSYSLNSGDTLRIAQGTYTGSITNVPGGAIIIVAANASFKPSSINFWTPAGKIINNGIILINSSLGIGGGFSIDNYGTITINGDMSLYAGATKTINNFSGAKITISGNLSLSDNTVLDNVGTINVTGSISLYVASASLTNTGLIYISNSLNNQGTLDNQNIISITNNLNLWGGSLSNSGAIKQGGTFSISSGMTYTNSCRLITSGAIVNNGTLINNGLVWAGTTNTAADQFTNSGTLINAAGAKLRTATFINYSNITGGGFIYATGQTTLGSSATIGIAGVTTDSIRVYDVTHTNGTGIFDNQWGTVRPNVKYAVFTAPDSIEMFAGCSTVFKNGSTLPVNWNYFYAKTLDAQPVLYWSAEYEADMKFEIERSYDAVNYSVIKTTVSNSSAVYTFTDASARKESSVYYRIKGRSIDGSEKYTAVKMISLASKSKPEITVYPNPVKNEASVNYLSDSKQQIIIRMKNSAGQDVLMKNFIANAGPNRFDLNETKNLKPGMYFIDMISGNEIIATQKLIKQ